MTYLEKLKDPRWQKKRLQIFERDGWRCVVTGRADETLHVHHRRYHGDPWDTPDEELETVCESVHYFIHDMAAFLRRKQPDVSFSAETVFKVTFEDKYKEAVV